MGNISSRLKGPLGFLFPGSQKEDLAAEHIIREHHRGRSLEDILQDAYIKNQVNDERIIARVLEREDVIHAIGEDTIAAFRTPPAG
jgi:hypothetical protein